MAPYNWGISKIAEEQIINQKSAVHKQALLFLATVGRKGNPVFIVFGSVLVEAVKQMNDFPHSLPAHEVGPFLEGGGRSFVGADFDDIIGDGIEAPPGQDYLMPSLWIFTDDSIN